MDGILRWLHPGNQRGMLARFRWAVLLSLLAARNAGNILRAPGAMRRLWMWHYRRRHVHAAVVHLPVRGDLTVPSSNQNSGMLVATGFTERGDQILVARLIGRSSVLVDVGANIGVYSVPAAASGATVVAYEPVSSTNAQLAANLAPYPSALVRPVAVGEVAGHARMHGTGVGATLNDVRGSEVEVVRLDDEELPRGDVIILKVDAEGRDIEVLRGAESFVRATQPVILCEVWHGGRDVRSYLSTLGFRAHRTTRNGELRVLSEGFSGDGNMVFVHPAVDALVRQRLGQPFRLDRLRLQFLTASN